MEKNQIVYAYKDALLAINTEIHYIQIDTVLLHVQQGLSNILKLKCVLLNARIVIILMQLVIQETEYVLISAILHILQILLKINVETIVDGGIMGGQMRINPMESDHVFKLALMIGLV